jgi:pectate lyase
MKKTRVLSMAFSVVLCLNSLFAQGQCSVSGWASQNGGVTGGGTATPTVVSTYSELKAALTSSSVKVVHISGAITIPAAGRISFQERQ